MKVHLVIPGALFALAGLTFALQGEGIVGPTSSFMFQTSTWVYQGLAIFIVGILLLAAGTWKRHPEAT